MKKSSIGRYFPIFVLPTLVAFSMFFLIPFLMGIGLSFFKFTTVADMWQSSENFVGIKNYVTAFTTDNDFVNALGFSSMFTLVSIVTVNVFAFILALLLTKEIKGVSVFRSVFFMPNLIGGIVLGYIWKLLINAVLAKLNSMGLTEGSNITSDAAYGFFGLTVLTNWQLIGYMMIIYIAGLQAIPQDMMEAAKIDGASRMQTLFHITIPNVMPSITICMFLTLANTFKMFDQNLSLTGGGPEKQTQMLALDIFKTFFDRDGWQGVGQAKAVVFFIIVALIAFIQLKITNKKEVEQ